LSGLVVQTTRMKKQLLPAEYHHAKFEVNH